MDVKNEKLILQNCQDGDFNAFNKLVCEYNSRVYFYARSILHNHHDALDISQDAFVKAYRSIKSFDLSKPFLPWVLRIVRNLCFNELKKKKRRAENPNANDNFLLLNSIPSDAKQPHEIIEQKEQAREIQTAMNKLSDAQRETVFLYHFEDLSYEQIADITGVPTGTVMSRLFNARKKLAALLKYQNE